MGVGIRLFWACAALGATACGGTVNDGGRAGDRVGTATADEQTPVPSWNGTGGGDDDARGAGRSLPSPDGSGQLGWLHEH